MNPKAIGTSETESKEVVITVRFDPTAEVGLRWCASCNWCVWCQAATPGEAAQGIIDAMMDEAPVYREQLAACGL